MRGFVARYAIGDAYFHRTFQADDLEHAIEQAVDATEEGETYVRTDPTTTGASLAKFYGNPPGEEMDHDDVIYRLVWDDVITTASKHDLPLDLTPDEMYVFRKCLESGLSCWAEVVQLALAAAVSERNTDV